jgi:hypothetical protein
MMTRALTTTTMTLATARMQIVGSCLSTTMETAVATAKVVAIARPGRRPDSSTRKHPLHLRLCRRPKCPHSRCPRGRDPRRRVPARPGISELRINLLPQLALVLVVIVPLVLFLVLPLLLVMSHHREDQRQLRQLRRLLQRAPDRCRQGSNGTVVPHLRPRHPLRRRPHTLLPASTTTTTTRR